MRTCTKFPGPHPPDARIRGFTLLEVVLAVGILTIIIGLVFATARSSLAVGSTVVRTQNEAMMHQAFFELLSSRFAAMPGNTRFDLVYQDISGQYISDLTLQNVPLGFNWGGESKIAKSIQISTVPKRGGFVDVVLRYYEYEILEGSESTPGVSTADIEMPFAEVVLLSDLAYFEWSVLDGRTMEWQYDWDIQGRLPLQIELLMAFGTEGEEIRQVFWVPPKQNPEVLMRQMLQSGNGNQFGEGAPDRPDGGDRPDRPGGGGRPGRPGGGEGPRPGASPAPATPAPE